MSDKLSIELNAKVDKNDRTYYVGKLDIPGKLVLEGQVVFLVFTADSGCEQLQIGPDRSANKEKPKKSEPEVFYTTSKANDSL
jgi:hypothetical protein